MRKKDVTKTGLAMAVPEEAVDGGRAYAGRFLAAVFLMMGLSGLFVPAFPSVSCGWVIPGICGASICLGIFLLAGYSKGRQAAVLIPYLLFAGIFYGRIRDGFLILSNDMLHFMTEKTGKIYLDFQVNAEGNVYFTLFSIGFLAAFLTANAIWYGTLWPVSPVIFLAAAALISGFSREVIAAAVFLAGLLLIPIFREQIGKDREEKGNLPAYAAVIAVSLVLLLTAGTFLGRMDLFQENWWKDSVHRFLYDSSTESMPEGNLKNLGSWRKSDAAALSLKADQYGKLYLRGVIRENYTGTAWEELPAEERADSEALFYWLHKNDFYGNEMIGLASDLTEEETGEQTIEITNLGACREHLYLPYALHDRSTLSADVIGDAEVKKKEQSYQISYLPGSVPQWYSVLQKLADGQKEDKEQEYLRCEDAYRKYVYDKDLQITDTAAAALGRLLPPSEGRLKLSEIKDRIYQCLEENLAYDESAVTLNGNNDFLAYTLEQKKKGYSVHYATAAVLMLRYYGVPARYVEGYYLRPEEASQAVPGEELVLDETHAHAWAEYYLDGIGWIPFETTPGYIDQEEIGVSENDGLGQDSYETPNKDYMAQEEPDLLEEESGDRGEWKVTPLYLLWILLLLLLILVGRQIYRRRQFLKKLQEMELLSPKEGVAAWYGYAVCLMQYGGTAEESENQEMRALSDEALFSSHSMTEEQKEQEMKFAEQVRENCMAKWNLAEKLKYRWILCICR